MRLWGVEDLDFSFKCWSMGFRILHDPEAVVGHLFRTRFDTYDVPLPQFAANQLRMARKNFTYGVWRQWVERHRQRHEGLLEEHPEGLWASTWMLFEQDRASVEEERTYLLARRARDEFWYADRFALPWPRLEGEQPAPFFGPAEPLQASPSPPPEKPFTDPHEACDDDEVECCDCPCNDGTLPFPTNGLFLPGSPRFLPTDFSEEPVRYHNGEVQLAVTDLAAGGFGVRPATGKHQSPKLMDFTVRDGNNKKLYSGHTQERPALEDGRTAQFGLRVAPLVGEPLRGSHPRLGETRLRRGSASAPIGTGSCV